VKKDAHTKRIKKMKDKIAVEKKKGKEKVIMVKSKVIKKAK
jgi:hypothetical protein